MVLSSIVSVIAASVFAFATICTSSDSQGEYTKYFNLRNVVNFECKGTDILETLCEVDYEYTGDHYFLCFLAKNIENKSFADYSEFYKWFVAEFYKVTKKVYSGVNISGHPDLKKCLSITMDGIMPGFREATPAEYYKGQDVLSIGYCENLLSVAKDFFS